MAKNKPAPAPVVHVLSEDLHTELEQLELAIPKVLWQEGAEVEVKEKSLDAAVNVLTLARAALKKLDDEAAKLIEATMPKEVADKLAAIAKEKKALKAKGDKVDDALKRGLLSALATGVLTKEGFTTKAGCTISVVGKDDIEITDLDAIDEKFMLPAQPDLKAIREALEADARRAAAAAELDLPVPEPTIHGAIMTKKYHFTTRTPDVIEET